MLLKFDVTEFVTFENIWCLQSPKMFLDKWMRLHSSNYRYTIPLIIASKPHSWINWCSTSISQNLRNTKGQGGGLAWHKTICCLGVECMHFFAKFGNLVNRVYNNLQNFTTKYIPCLHNRLFTQWCDTDFWITTSLERLLIMVLRQWFYKSEGGQLPDFKLFSATL